MNKIINLVKRHTGLTKGLKDYHKRQRHYHLHESLKTNAKVANAGACFDEKRTKYKTQSKEDDDDKAHHEF